MLGVLSVFIQEVVSVGDLINPEFAALVEADLVHVWRKDGMTVAGTTPAGREVLKQEDKS
jgi:hypothetical protein